MLEDHWWSFVESFESYTHLQNEIFGKILLQLSTTAYHYRFIYYSLLLKLIIATYNYSF